MKVRGIPIATIVELQTYLYEIPEDREPSVVLTRFVAGQEVGPGELFAALDGPDRDAAGDSDTAREVLELLKRRLAAAFPGEVGEDAQSCG